MLRSIVGRTLLLGSIAATVGAQEPAAGTERMVEIDGRAVRVLVAGLDARRPGTPVVVLEGGATNAIEAWRDLPARIAALAPVVAYDRAGLGRSEWDSVTPTPRHVAARLRRVLAAIGAEPPYVLVGYSWGGVLARHFAGMHPAEIAGIVYIDPAPLVTQPLEEHVAPFDSVGAGRAGFDAYWSGFRSFFERSPPAVRAEFDVFHGLLLKDLADRDLLPVPDVPTVAIVAARHQPLPPSMRLPFDPRVHFQVETRFRTRVIQQWVDESSNGTLVVSNALTHAIPREDPGLIVWAIERVLHARSGGRRGTAPPPPPVTRAPVPGLMGR